LTHRGSKGIIEHMFEFHGDVLPPPPGLDVALGVTRPVMTNGAIDVRATLDSLADDSPGPWMAHIAVHLAAMSRQNLTPAERVDLLMLMERCEAWMSAQKQRVLADLNRDAGCGRAAEQPGSAATYEDIALEIGMALNWSQRAVSERLTVAEQLDERLPATWYALAEGQLDYAKARAIALGADKLTDDAQVLELEQRVLPKVDGLILNDVRKLVERHVMAIDPAGAEERRQRVRGGRQVRRSPGEDGGAHLNAFGPAEAIAVIDTALTVGARMLKETGQVDNLDQGRFDTLLDWSIRHLEERVLPTRGALPVGATVIVKGSTAAGQDDDPAEIAGFGPVTAQTARDLLAGKPPAPGPFDKWDGKFAEETPPRDEPRLPSYMTQREFEPPPQDEELPPDDWQWQPPSELASQPRSASPPTLAPTQIAWRVLKVDPATGWALPPPGVRLNYGSERRLATAAQARYVRDRDRTCGFPTCNQSGRQVQIDHRWQSAQGGPTDEWNLGPGCVHHNCTTRNRNWVIKPDGNGAATLITPQGRRYPITPFDYLG
jgi:hypothetical protein